MTNSPKTSATPTSLDELKTKIKESLEHERDHARKIYSAKK